MDASEKIDQYIANTKDWKGETISKLRKIIHDASSEITEEWKWNSPVFLYKGKMICSPGAFKTHVGVNFFDGASLKDSNKLFNSGLDAKKTRAVNLNKDDKLPAKEFKALVKEAIKFSVAKKIDDTSD